MADKNSHDKRQLYNRTVIGAVAAFLLIGAVVLHFYPPESAGMQQLKSACWRLGPVLFVWWLAYPQAKNLPAWLAGVIPVLIIILAVRPKWIVVAIPILIAFFLLKKRG